MNEKIETNNKVPFINEVVMNEFTIREILKDIWVYKKSRNKIPVIIFIIAVVGPMIYGFITSKTELVLLSGILLLPGIVCLFAFLWISAYQESKKWKQTISEVKGKYGENKTLTVLIGETISWRFDSAEKSVSFCDIEKIMELKMYLILLLKNGVVLPIWKIGFTKGEWNDCITYFKRCMKKMS